MKALKQQLNIRLNFQNDPTLKLDESNPLFRPKMKQAIKLFQARFADSNGVQLAQDGQVGSLTWAALFGQASASPPVAINDRLLNLVVKIAAAEEAAKVSEDPVGSNRGPKVDEYLKRTGVSVGLYWCCAFVYWCFHEASQKMNPPQANPMVKTAGCLNHWNRAQAKGAKLIKKLQAVNDPSLLKPGMVFIIDHGRGMGHTGIIESINAGYITTIEGNTNPNMSSNGYGVFRLKRKIVDINKGFIDYSAL